MFRPIAWPGGNSKTAPQMHDGGFWIGSRRIFTRLHQECSSGLPKPMTALPVGRGLSSLLSDVCDVVYSASPEISNEMLGRRELTSQAAKARRELLTAMVEHHDEEWLGMEGFGPEKAMYAALLRHPRIHRDNGDGTFGYHQPGRAA